MCPLKGQILNVRTKCSPTSIYKPSTGSNHPVCCGGGAQPVPNQTAERGEGSESSRRYVAVTWIQSLTRLFFHTSFQHRTWLCLARKIPGAGTQLHVPEKREEPDRKPAKNPPAEVRDHDRDVPAEGDLPPEVSWHSGRSMPCFCGSHST